jgi:predicted HTH domain antitoxin
MLRLSPTEFVKEMRVAAALLWCSQGELSQSTAAKIAGTSRAEFIDELAHRCIPVVQVTTEELQDESDHRVWGSANGPAGTPNGRTSPPGLRSDCYGSTSSVREPR